ncbi:C-type lectin BiL isoform X2, partial [Biomphalaria glabrata]
AACESSNSSLAEFEDDKEAYLFISTYASNFWIGMYVYKPEQSWVWISDNKTVNMSYWNDRPLYLYNEPCGLILYSQGLRIRDYFCDSLEYYICMSI